ncbi:hypothetical protein B0H14DRAFT_225077 [Mycena olivaceomarginata]|nr:hypothetical protein B0H14DRAFT_225077 [Mycena olivaceomarginata]
MCFLFWNLPLTTTRTCAWQATTLGFHLDVFYVCKGTVLGALPCRSTDPVSAARLQVIFGPCSGPDADSEHKGPAPDPIQSDVQIRSENWRGRRIAAGCLAVPQERPRGPWR